MKAICPILGQIGLWLFLILATGCATVPPEKSMTCSPSQNVRPPAELSLPTASAEIWQAAGHDPASQSPAAGLQSTNLPAPTNPDPFAGMDVLSAEALVDQVVTRSPTVAQMVAVWQSVTARYPQVTSLEDPNLGLTMAPASFGSNSVQPGYAVEVMQKLPFPGKLRLRGQNAAAEANAAGKDVDDIRLQLVETAKNAFYEYYLVFRAITVNEEGMELLKSGRKSAESRVSTGKASQQEVLQIDVEIGRQRERALNLGRMKKVAVARINTLMHLPPASPLPPPPAKLMLPGELPPSESLLATASANRPDVRAVADRLAAEQAMLALAQREYYPDFEAGASYNTIMGNGPMRDLAPQLSLRMNLPVRQSRRAAAVAEAEGRVAQRRAELDRLTDQVNFQVQEAYEQVLETGQVVALYEETILPAAQNNVKSAQPAYSTGQIPLLSYLETQRNLVSLRDRYYEVIAEHFRRRAALDRAIGSPVGAQAIGSGKMRDSK
jgi:outer membrane protein, heavy metal efflux system